MTPRTLPFATAGLAVLLATSFAMLVRLPLPFDGFAAVMAAVLAVFLTLSFALFAPAHWIWTDAERLQHAFAQRHGLSDLRSNNVLAAITNAHARATKMRQAARHFQTPLDERTLQIADRIDLIARDLFYNPDALSVHRESLIRSELIEEALDAHAKLRRRGQSQTNAEQINESRARVATVLDALDNAFDSNENRLADQLLTQVDISSATAERLLRRGQRT